MKPWKVIGWVIPPQHNSHFVAAMEKVLDVYKRAYNKLFPVICMDESPKQLIRETRSSIAMRPGRDRKEDFEYERCGVANIFLASEPLNAKRYVEVTDRKTKNDWAKFIRNIADVWYKDAKKITLVMDNLATQLRTRQPRFMRSLNQVKRKEYWIGLNLFTHPSMAVG